MAAANHLQGLMEETTCSICLEYFVNPVSVRCGHVFCLSCISRCWEGLETDFKCPQCRETSQNKTLRPIRHLGNIVELLKHLHIPSAAPQGEDLCREHEEKLKLFCEDDQEPICVVCRESRDHKTHSVLPIPEAAQKYKKTLHNHVERLQKELENLQIWEDEQRRTVSDLEVNFENQAETIHSTFELLKQFLDKEEQQLISKLETEHNETIEKMQEKLSELEKQQSILRDMIAEIEGKCQQQDVQLLQDVQIILSRSNRVKAQKSMEDAVVWWTLQSIGQNASLQEKLLELKATFPAELVCRYIKPGESTFPTEREWRYIKTWATEITLDPDTANPWLIISEIGRSVRLGVRPQDLLDTPQRCNPVTSVLGRERLSSGKHYWEVEVGDKTGWDLGVCDESVSRKEVITLCPKNGYWVVWLRDGKYKALTSPSAFLFPRTPPRVVGLFLDYEAGRLSVYNVEEKSLLFTFFGTSFPRTLRPFFNPGLIDGGKNAGVMQILPVGRE
ncbi:E3 ubiquitin-protein ligase TRIM11-like [Pleurodeles waltl]|uniref:E3 ubiquitin-protein ligase TRIM11-like n=1 Tax=Pleurodeles waltl TaxID=8319 RepID=UPI003709C45A